MQRLPRMRKERRRIKEKCDCTRPEDVVDWKKNKGVVGGIRDAIRPTTKEKAFLLALYEMTRLICYQTNMVRMSTFLYRKRPVYQWELITGTQKAFSEERTDGNERVSGKKFEDS